jgi:glycosyltransferase involved in cell wall biosynthesis
MKRVALLAYYFPPLGGAGVQRAVAMAQHLPKYGWDPVVVTGPGRTTDRWAPVDDSLGADLRGEHLVRVRGPEPSRTDERATRWLRVPSLWRRWWVDAATEALSGVEADVILVTMSPFEGAAAAAEAARRSGRPWIADLRDPWALDEMFVYPTALHRRLELRAMAAALQTAAAIVLNTAEARSAFDARFPELAPKTAVVTNGFDDADRDIGAEPRADDRFRIVHTGYLHTELSSGGARDAVRKALRGSFRGVQIGSRSHVHLVEAVDDLIRTDPALGARIELHLAGVTSPKDAAAADRPYIRWRGYLEHDASVALLRSADALFLPMHDLARGGRARIVPGKTYEYLAADRPILAAVPDGDARDLLARAGNAVLCRPTDPAALARGIRAIAAGEVRSAARPRVLVTTERAALAGVLAGVLDGAAVSGERQPARGLDLRGRSLRAKRPA